MARQIIVLDSSVGVGGETAVRVVFWFPVATGREYKKPSFQSAVDPVLAGPTQAVSVAELTALQNGTVLEEVFLKTFAKSKSNVDIKAELQQQWVDRAAYVAGLPNPIAFYGVSLDSVAGWSA